MHKPRAYSRIRPSRLLLPRVQIPRRRDVPGTTLPAAGRFSVVVLRRRGQRRSGMVAAALCPAPLKTFRVPFASARRISEVAPAADERFVASLAADLRHKKTDELPPVLTVRVSIVMLLRVLRGHDPQGRRSLVARVGLPVGLISAPLLAMLSRASPYLWLIERRERESLVGPILRGSAANASRLLARVLVRPLGLL